MEKSQDSRAQKIEDEYQRRMAILIARRERHLQFGCDLFTVNLETSEECSKLWEWKTKELQRLGGKKT